MPIDSLTFPSPSPPKQIIPANNYLVNLRQIYFSQHWEKMIEESRDHRSSEKMY